MDKQIIASLRTWMPATSGYTTNDLFPTPFVSGSEVTNFSDNTLSNHIYLAFKVDSTLNPNNINNTDSNWASPTSLTYTTMAIETKSISLSLIQSIFIIISIGLILFAFTPWYQKSRKTFNLLNLIIPSFLIFTMFMMLINYSIWIGFTSNFENISDITLYNSFTSKGPDGVSLKFRNLRSYVSLLWYST